MPTISGNTKNYFLSHRYLVHKKVGHWPRKCHTCKEILDNDGWFDRLNHHWYCDDCGVEYEKKLVVFGEMDDMNKIYENPPF